MSAVLMSKTKQKSVEAFVVNHDFALKFTADGREKTIFIKAGIDRAGKKAFLFHDKTRIFVNGNCITARTSALSFDKGAPIPGLAVNYSFTFHDDLSAVYLSVSYESDTPLMGCSVRVADISWQGPELSSYTGYEFDAEGKPYEFKAVLPDEVSSALSYDELQSVTPHTAWEKTVNRIQTFCEGVSLEGKEDYIGIIGGSPTLNFDSRFISAFSDIKKYSGDLRFFSGKNSPGLWLLFEKPESFFESAKTLYSKTPELPSQTLFSSCSDTIELSSGKLRVSLLRSNGGIWINPIDKKGGISHQQPVPLFALSLWDTEFQRTLELDSGAGWDSIDILQKKHFLRVILSNPDTGRATGISVIAEASLFPDKHRICWKMRVINRSERWSVLSATYPQCVSCGYLNALTSASAGCLIERFAKRGRVYSGIYPTGAVMPLCFSALYDPVSFEERENALNGLYMGVHDPNGSYKKLTLAGTPQSECALFSVQCPGTYLRKPGNCLSLPGEAVWQIFSGDWYDAANIYRDFVQNHATYFPTMRGREDTPQWIRENPVWVMEFLPNENPDSPPIPITLRSAHESASESAWYQDAIQLKKELGVPVAYHVYNWHWVPFNNDNPNYFPTHPVFKEGVRALHEAGIRVVPYIAAYSWDMNDNRGEDYRFQNEAYPATAKDENGAPISKSYASTKPNGALVKFARMCPSTAFWKNELRQVIRRLYTDYDADGIYLDVVSAGYDHCSDETHLHTPGYGNSWWQAYSELIQSIRIDAPQDFALISESVSEVYTAQLDAFLSWTWVQPGSVPVYPRIYAGYVNIFGRVITLNKRHDDLYFRFHIAQELLFGQQLGWIHPEIVHDKAQFGFLKKMVKLRWGFREFFTSAEMIRPPLVEGKIGYMNTESFIRSNYLTHEKTVLSAVWAGVDGSRVLFVINADSQEAECTLSLLREECKLPEKIEQFTLCDGFEWIGKKDSGAVTKLSCRIAPEGYGVLIWNSGDSSGKVFRE